MKNGLAPVVALFYNKANAMSAVGRIVCGGGWKKRRDYHIKSKAVCCLVLILPALAACDEFADVIGMWDFIVPAGLLIASILLFRFERSQLFWWPPAGRLDELRDSPDSSVPKYDPRNLYWSS